MHANKDKSWNLNKSAFFKDKGLVRNKFVVFIDSSTKELT